MSIKNVPPTTGAKPPSPHGAKPSSLHQRFIPREELGDFASWKPGTFGDAQTGPRAAASAPSTPASAHEPSPAEWQAKVTAARQVGYQEGYRDGLVALESFKQTFAQQNTAQLGQLLQAFDEQLNQLDGDIAAALAQTAVQLARQVLRAELLVRPELVAQVASEAVGAVMLSARHISVQVHPLDLPLVAQGAEETLNARGARLSANAQMQRGGVLVHSDVGNIDARIGTRWSQAAAALGSVLPLQDEADDEVVNHDSVGAAA